MVRDSPVRVSVLTPSWNRASYLERVWKGLMSQTNKSIEWLVANDGSSDDTINVIKELAGKSPFPVGLINASIRTGKSRMDNELVKYASGEFILWCDSDDVLLPNAIEKLLETWASIPEERQNEFAGITALCDTKDGVLGASYPKNSHTDINLNELLLNLKSDLVIFTKSSLLKINEFPEVDFVISESAVWCKIGVLYTRFIPIVLKRVNYREANCISYSGLMEYNRGKAHAIAIAKDVLKDKLSFQNKLLRFVKYMRYCIHGEIEPIEMICLWKGGKLSGLAFVLFSPLVLVLVIKDHLQGKVRKTHREFEYAAKKVKVDRFILN